MTRLLEAAAQEAGAQVKLVPHFVPHAYDALLSGDAGRHDALLLEGIERLAGESLDGVVLAQVSMARVLPQLQGRVGVPVFSSLPTSLDAIRRLLG